MNAQRLQVLGEKSADRRGQIALVRGGLRSGQIPLPSLLADVPDCVADRPAWEVISWARWVGKRRLATLNRDAMEKRINLARPLRELTKRQRTWIADNVLSMSRR